MKVLIMNQHPMDILGGSEIQCDIIAEYLIKYGHEVVYGAINSSQESYNLSYRVEPMMKMNIMKFKKMLKKVNPDIVYWRFNKKHLLKASILCKFYNVKIVFSLSSINDVKKWSFKSSNSKNSAFLRKMKSNLGVIKQLFSSRINYFGYYLVDGVISLRKELIEQVPLKVPKKIVINNSMKDTINSEFTWEKPYVVWVANLKKSKNPELFIEAAKEFEKENLDFIMIGKVQQESYKYIEDKANLPNNLIYLGAQSTEKVNSILNKSLFLIHTCNSEGFGNNFIQAWLQGKPTISLFFDPDGLIEKYQIGFYSRSFDKMCEHIDFYLKNEKEVMAAGNRAKNLAKEMFNPNYNIKQFEKFFLEVIER